MLRLLRTFYKLRMYRKTLLVNKHRYIMLNTFLVTLIKMQFFYFIFLSLFCLIVIVYRYFIILSQYGCSVIQKLANGSVFVPERKAFGLAHHNLQCPRVRTVASV